MRRIAVGNGVCMITEIRKETPVLFPQLPRRRRLMGVFSLVLGVALFNVWISGQYYRIGYAVSSTLEEQRNLKKEQDLLKTEILMLRSPARIEAIAKAQLGMVDPKTERMIRVR
ncbi:MAG: cell division protein FtsL [Deltaproteobacteria bacterium]|nr:cell division protein FtsL [Deltaproteobacteria bacterium]